MKNLIRIFPLVLMASMIVSCSSDDDANIDTSTPESTIFNSSWDYVSITANPPVVINGNEFIDLLDINSPIEPCNRDNQYVFYSESEFLINESKRACEGNDPFSNVEEGTYQFSADKKTLEFSNGDRWKILKLDKASLIIETEETFDDENYSTLTVEFKRIG